MVQTAFASTGVIGKFAGHAEYLRAHGNDAASTFDDWVGAGIDWALSRHGPAWPPRFEMGLAFGFVWPGPPAARSGAVLAGVIAPSRDSLGRQYPLAIYTRFPRPALAPAPHLSPLAFGDFLDGAYATLTDARSRPIDPRELEARVQSLAFTPGEELARAEHEYGAWCQHTPLETAWAAVFPHSPPLESAMQIVEALAEAVRPFRGRENPSTSLVLRLPLGQGGPAAAVLWLDVVRKICRWSATVPSAFWAAEAETLLVGLGAVPPSALGELWLADPDNENVYDLTTPQFDGVPPSGLRDRAMDLRLRRPGASMGEYLNLLGGES